MTERRVEITIPRDHAKRASARRCIKRDIDKLSGLKVITMTDGMRLKCYVEAYTGTTYTQMSHLLKDEHGNPLLVRSKKEWGGYESRVWRVWLADGTPRFIAANTFLHGTLKAHMGQTVLITYDNRNLFKWVDKENDKDAQKISMGKYVVVERLEDEDYSDVVYVIGDDEWDAMVANALPTGRVEWVDHVVPGTYSYRHMNETREEDGLTFIYDRSVAKSPDYARQRWLGNLAKANESKGKVEIA